MAVEKFNKIDKNIAKLNEEVAKDNKIFLKEPLNLVDRATIAVNIAQGGAGDASSTGKAALTLDIPWNEVILPNHVVLKSNGSSLSLCKVTYTFSCTTQQLEKRDFKIEIDDKEFNSHERPPPCKQINTISPEKTSGVFSTWRMVRSGDKIYSTGNTDNTLSIVDCQTKKLVQERDLKRSSKKDFFFNVRGIAIDPDGKIYVTGSHVVLKYNIEGELEAHLGNYNIHGEFNDPNGIRYFDGNIYVCDSGNGRIRILALDLSPTHDIGKGELRHPEDLDFDDKGSYYVLDSKACSIVVFNANYAHIRDIKLNGIQYAASMRIFHDYFYVTDIIGHRLVIYSKTSEEKVYQFCFEEQEDACCGQHPVGLHVYSGNQLYVSNGNKILVYQAFQQ